MYVIIFHLRAFIWYIYDRKNQFHGVAVSTIDNE